MLFRQPNHIPEEEPTNVNYDLRKRTYGNVRTPYGKDGQPST